MKIRYSRHYPHIWYQSTKLLKVLLKFTNDMHNGRGIITVECEATCEDVNNNNKKSFCYCDHCFVFFLWVEVTAVTVADVHAADDNVFTTTVATSGSLPEHMLVNQHTMLLLLLLQPVSNNNVPLAALLLSSQIPYRGDV